MWHKSAASRAAFLKPSQPITCATFAQDVIEGRAKASQVHEHKHQPMIFGPATLIGGKLASERERMTAQVFQPGYRYEIVKFCFYIFSLSLLYFYGFNTLICYKVVNESISS